MVLVVLQNGKNVDGMNASFPLFVFLRVIVEGVNLRLDGRRDGRNVELSLSLHEKRRPD